MTDACIISNADGSDQQRCQQRCEHLQSCLPALLMEKYQLSRMLQVFEGPLNFAICECSIYQILSRRMNASYLLGLQVYNNVGSLVVPNDVLWCTLWDYHFLHMCELENGDHARVHALRAFTDARQVSLAKLQAHTLPSPWLSRDEHGWLTKEHGLPLMPLHTLHGVAIAKMTQTVSLVYAKSEHGTGFLSWRDVANLFLMHAESLPLYFSLDPAPPPYRRSPLYTCDALPKSYAHTDAFHSLAHADWILKQIAVGAEVSAHAPFASRPLVFDEPWLRPLAARGSKFLGPHRFWLACDTIEYKVEEKEDMTVMYFGKVTFQLRGHLKSLEVEDEEVGKDHAVESFCQDLSSHWEELKVKFPIFRRVEEIAKLQFCQKFLSNYRDTFDRSRAADVAARIKATTAGGANDKVVARVVAHFSDQRERITSELHRIKSTFGKRHAQKPDPLALRYMPCAFNMDPRCFGGVLMYPKLCHCDFPSPSGHGIEVKRITDAAFQSPPPPAPSASNSTHNTSTMSAHHAMDGHHQASTRTVYGYGPTSSSRCSSMAPSGDMRRMKRDNSMSNTNSNPQGGGRAGQRLVGHGNNRCSCRCIDRGAGGACGCAPEQGGSGEGDNDLVLPIDSEYSPNFPKGPCFQGHLKVKEAMQVAKLLKSPTKELEEDDLAPAFLEAILRTKYARESREEAAYCVAKRCGAYRKHVRVVPSPPRARNTL